MHTLMSSAGMNFGQNQDHSLGMKMEIIEISLYLIKSSVASWRAKLAETMESLRYKSYKADTGVYMKRYFKTNVEPY